MVLFRQSNGTHYIFKLKQNVIWHDGAPFTAEDVKFTFDKILDQTTNTVRRSNFILDGKPVGLILLNTPLRPSFQPFAILIRMSMGILLKHIFENEDINKSTYNRSPIGTVHINLNHGNQHSLSN